MSLTPLLSFNKEIIKKGDHLQFEQDWMLFEKTEMDLSSSTNGVALYLVSSLLYRFQKAKDSIGKIKTVVINVKLKTGESFVSLQGLISCLCATDSRNLIAQIKA